MVESPEIKFPLNVGRLIRVKDKSRKEANVLQESINRNVCEPHQRRAQGINESNKHTFIDSMNPPTRPVLARPRVGMIISEDMSREAPIVTSI